jgi:hypothetical protein
MLDWDELSMRSVRYEHRGLGEPTTEGSPRRLGDLLGARLREYGLTEADLETAHPSGVARPADVRDETGDPCVGCCVGRPVRRVRRAPSAQPFDQPAREDVFARERDILA